MKDGRRNCGVETDLEMTDEAPPYDPEKDPGVIGARNWRDGYVPGRRRGRKPKVP